MSGSDDPTLQRRGEATLAADPLIGRTIDGRYELMARLGEGGFGAVYRAHDTLLRRDVALKLLGAVGPDNVRERFVREARATARLHHPGIVSIYDAGQDPSGLYLVLELVHGRPLSDIATPLSAERTTYILLQIAEALAAAHALGIVHRDIKPANILLAVDDHVKVADFGIARVIGEAQITATGSTIGTPRYMAPEQLEGKEITPAADLFSLGVVAYQMLTGTTPFAGETFPEVLANVVRGKWQRVAPGVSAETPLLWREIERLLDADPGRRGSAADFAAALRAPPTATRIRRRPRHIAVAVATVIIVSGGVLLLWRRHAPLPSPTTTKRIHLQHARPADFLNLIDTKSQPKARTSSAAAAEVSGSIAGVPVTMRGQGASEMDVEAAPSDVARAAAAVSIVDALAGYRFFNDPNLFTGASPSQRRITCSGTFPAGEFLALLARTTGWPLVQDLSIKRLARAEIPIHVTNGPWDEVAMNVIHGVGLELWRDGDVWVVESPERRRIRERITPIMFVSFGLEHRADPEVVAASLRPLLSERGEAVVWKRTRQIIVLDTAPRMEEVKRIIDALDRTDTTPAKRIEEHRSEYTGRKLSLHLHEADLAKTLERLANMTGLPLFVDPAVQGTVSVDLRDVPWDNAFNSILRSQGATLIWSDNLARVVPESKLSDGERAVLTMHLKNDKPSAFLAFKNALAPVVEIILADDLSGTLVLRGDKRIVEPMVHTFGNIDSLAPHP